MIELCKIWKRKSDGKTISVLPICLMSAGDTLWYTDQYAKDFECDPEDFDIIVKYVEI